jgi:hypothetical protein
MNLNYSTLWASEIFFKLASTVFYSLTMKSECIKNIQNTVPVALSTGSFFYLKNHIKKYVSRQLA